LTVPPFAYLKDVLLRVATRPQHSIGQLTPQRLGRDVPPPSRRV